MEMKEKERFNSSPLLDTCTHNDGRVIINYIGNLSIYLSILFSLIITTRTYRIKRHSKTIKYCICILLTQFTVRRWCRHSSWYISGLVLHSTNILIMAKLLFFYVSVMIKYLKNCNISFVTILKIIVWNKVINVVLISTNVFKKRILLNFWRTCKCLSILYNEKVYNFISQDLC